MQGAPPQQFLLWGVLFAGPMLFVLAFIGASVFIGARPGVDPSEIPSQVMRLIPEILLAVQLGLAVILAALYFFAWPATAAALFPAPSIRAVTDGAIGLCVGLVLAAAYIYVLAPALEFLQRTVGDYVPPGEALSAVSGRIGIFFIANVMLAPLVEEALYRGYALPALSQQFGTAIAVTISCLFFGLLHWPGGLWYMLLTGGVAGGTFAALYLWRGDLLAPFLAHLTLNSIEFLYAWHLRSNAAVA